MSDISFYGGVDEIGGNKIKLDMDSTSLLLDFGMSFKQYGKFFSEFINPRKANGIGDFIELGLIPDVKGIYRSDFLGHMGIPQEEKPAVDGLLLSHAHADHADYISHLRSDIPIYMTRNSKIILQVIDETGLNYGFKDIYQYKTQFTYVPKKTGSGFKKLTGDEAKHPRDIRILEPYDVQAIGDLNVQLAPVDHSLPGAAGFLIEGSQENVVYTGDLRFHGRNRDLTRDFVKHARRFSPNVMICEGTRINSEEHRKEFDDEGNRIEYLELEEDIEERVYNLIGDFKGLVIANFPLRDLDRLITFHNIAKETDRTLLVSTKQAYMLKLIEEENEEKTIYPSIHDENIGIYIRRKGDGLVSSLRNGDGHSSDFYVSKDNNWVNADEDIYIKEYEKWEREFLDYDNAYTYRDIQDNESGFIIRLDNFSFMELIDIKPENAIYLHSTTEPFNEEMEMNYEITENWLNHFDIPIYNHFHVSGHAKGPELLEMVREIHPDVLYPVHTEHAELYDVLKDDGIKVIHPSLSK